MQATRKNVKRYLIKAGYIAIFFIIAIIGFSLLPRNTFPVVIFVSIWFVIEYWLEIGLVAFAIFVAYRYYRHIKHTDNPWRVVRVDLRKNLIILFSVALIIYGCKVFLATKFPTEYGRCDYYNQELNGGIKEFQGQKFKINMCGTGGHSTRFHFELDEIRLQIFNEKGDLVAIRHFNVNWDGVPSHNPIEQHPDHITYYDDADQNDSERTITMPPTVLDWIRARLPYFN